MHTVSFLKLADLSLSVSLIVLSHSVSVYLLLPFHPPFRSTPQLSPPPHSGPVNERAYLGLIGLRANINKQWLSKKSSITAAVGK